MDSLDYQKIFDDSLDDLLSLLRIPSVYDSSTVTKEMPYGKGVYDALCFMRNKAYEDGFEVLEFDHHCIAIRYQSNCSKRIDIVSHLDVVEAKNDWDVDPFAAVIVDDKIIARGSQDMKTSAWLTYLALKMLKEYEKDIDCEIRIVLGCDEERTMDDMKYYIQCAGYPDFAFTPDGQFPMGIGEKGALMWRLRQHYEGIIESLSGGIQCNVVAPYASCVVNSLKVDEVSLYMKKHSIKGKASLINHQLHLYIEGKAAHASLPENGHNATIDLLEILANCFNDFWAKKMFACFKDAYGRGCHCDFDIEPMGKVTINLGILKLENHQLYGEVDARYPYGVTSNELTRYLQEACPMNVSLDYDDEPTLCSQEDPYIQTLLETYRRITHDESEPLISGGVSYSKVFKHCVSFGPSKMNDEHVAHQANEYVYYSQCPKNLEIYYEAIKAIAKKE